MANRREFLRRIAAASSVAVLGTVAAAALSPALGPTSVGPSATTRKYRIGSLMGYTGISGCEGEPNDWQATEWGWVRMNPPARPVDASCPESIVRTALAARGYRIGDNLEVTK